MFESIFHFDSDKRVNLKSIYRGRERRDPKSLKEFEEGIYIMEGGWSVSCIVLYLLKTDVLSAGGEKNRRGKGKEEKKGPCQPLVASAFDLFPIVIDDCWPPAILEWRHLDGKSCQDFA